MRLLIRMVREMPFAGGFMGKLILGGNGSRSVLEMGQWLAGLCLRCNGPAYGASATCADLDIHSETGGSGRDYS
jgi:hypothetical protein